MKTDSATEPCQTIALVCDGKISGDAEMEEMFAKELQNLFNLFASKQKSYGRGNIARFGEKGVLIRVSDKLERLIRLVWKGVENPLNKETVDDTWQDIGVYSIIALMCRKGKWI